MKKDLVDETRSLDILSMQRSGVFDGRIGHSWTVRWKWGDEVRDSISYRVDGHEGRPTSLRFEYLMPDESGAKSLVSYRVGVSFTPCHFGNGRWWFVCPLACQGTACTRRCRLLYLPGGARYFGCRRCYGLTYECRQKHRDKFYEALARPLKLLDRQSRVPRSPKGFERYMKEQDKLAKAMQVFRSKFTEVDHDDPETD